jgi:hypothetical protein
MRRAGKVSTRAKDLDASGFTWRFGLVLRERFPELEHKEGCYFKSSFPFQSDDDL